MWYVIYGQVCFIKILLINKLYFLQLNILTYFA